LESDAPVDCASVKMINTNFSLNSSVNLNKIIHKFSQINGVKVTFDPDRYSAVKLKFTPKPEQKQVTASIFSTGKIIVTGAQTLEEIAGAYELINKTIDASILVKPVAEPELFETIMGARFEEWVRVLDKTAANKM
jgi:TATA-box binding protein (TBP) (component of TFIID and TFIIIB)